MSDDAEFDAFLKREGALSQRLHGLGPDQPGAALDAAILQRARDLMAQEAARPVAANDGGDAMPAPRATRLGWRWRVPAGIAATVLAGVFAHQAYQTSGDLQGTAGKSEPLEETIAVPEQRPAAPAPAPMAEMKANAPVSAPAERRAPARKRQPAPAPAPVMQQEQAPVADSFKIAPPPAPAPAPMASDKAANATSPIAGYAPASAARARAPIQSAEVPASRFDAESLNRVQVTGSREAVAVPTPAQWLASIEAMLESDKAGDAALAWRQFRQAYPDYPVPQTTQDKIDALQK